MWSRSTETETNRPVRRAWRRWLRRGFLIWAFISTLWLANSYRTRGVADDVLQTSPTVSVVDGATTLEFKPTSSDAKSGLIFICGSGVAAYAYAPMLRPIAEAGYPVFIVKLPFRFAPLESQKQTAVECALSVIGSHPEISQWVLSGHSLGGALACRAVRPDPTAFSAMVLVGTTHPKLDDLSSLTMRITKVYASNDGIAPKDKILSSKQLLPKETQWVEIEGGNHSQFGHYGHQLFDGRATISREAQQAATRVALLETLKKVMR
jgi:hypothetical protein